MSDLLHNPPSTPAPPVATPAARGAWWRGVGALRDTAAARALVALVAGAGGGAAVELIGARGAAAGLAVLGGLAALLRWWPGSALAALLPAAALNRFTVPGGGANIKPEHVAALAVGAGLILRWALTPPGPARARLRWGPGLALGGLALYLGANLGASILNAPQPGDSLRLVGLITLVTLPYGLVLNVVTRRADLRRALALWFALGVFEALSGLVIMFLWSRFGLDLGVQQVLGVPPVPVGTLREGNILGSYTAAAAVGLFAWLLTTPPRPAHPASRTLPSVPTNPQPPNLISRTSNLKPQTSNLVSHSSFLIPHSWLVLAGAIMLAGLAITLARGAWLGFGAGAALVGLVRAGTLLRRGRGLALIGLLLLPVGGFWASTPDGQRVVAPVLQRLATLNTASIADDITVAERLYTYEKAQEGIAAQPILGNGTGSFGQRYLFLSVDEPAWVGNLELHLLYDSGLLGFAGFWLALGVVGWRAARAYRRTRDPLLRAALLGLGGGLVTLLVAYQATEATWLAFTWVHVGLLAAATALVPAPGAVGDPLLQAQIRKNK